MAQQSTVYFAELDSSNNIISVVSSLEGVGSLNNTFTPSQGESNILTAAFPSVVYKNTTWKLYPEDGTLVGGNVSYTWDSVEGKWSDGTNHYVWINGSAEGDDGRYSQGSWVSS